MADDQRWSRLWAGIRFRADIKASRTLGRNVGKALVEYAAGDGVD